VFEWSGKATSIRSTGRFTLKEVVDSVDGTILIWKQPLIRSTGPFRSENRCRFDRRGHSDLKTVVDSIDEAISIWKPLSIQSTGCFTLTEVVDPIDGTLPPA